MKSITVKVLGKALRTAVLITGAIVAAIELALVVRVSRWASGSTRERASQSGQREAPLIKPMSTR